jgi:1,4-dihydroxy-2-naphthoate polyprenyltransferase
MSILHRFMLQKSTIQLLRFYFSIFLMPVYWFGLSQTPYINWKNAVLIFFILHILVYPASNGYNSYMDRDETPIGGIKKPLQPTKQLFYATLFMDFFAIVLSFLIGIYFMVGIVLYIIVSRAYSYRGIRLKKYPIIGFLSVIIFQGAVTFWLVYHGSSTLNNLPNPWLPMLASSLLIGGFYPLTQIYQHTSDKENGVTTISYLLGYKGTFRFTLLIYALAFVILSIWFYSTLQLSKFFLLQLFFIPVLIYFIIWAKKIWKNVEAANFENTMKMNWIASICSNIGFITLLILNCIE